MIKLTGFLNDYMRDIKEREKSKPYSKFPVRVTGQVMGPISRTGTHLGQMTTNFVWDW